jgi:hypothetical protein
MARPAGPADNWAVALTDIARLVRAQQPGEAYECLTAAASKYAQSLAVLPDNPQVWGGVSDGWLRGGGWELVAPAGSIAMPLMRQRVARGRVHAAQHSRASPLQ